jgi:predicted 2-oxoglutarate/Fe(II)-dependent dioxygenase YbiX
MTSASLALTEDATSPSFYPLNDHPAFCLVVPDFLSPAECRAYIKQSEARGFSNAASDYPPSYRNNDRQLIDDPILATAMIKRLKAHAPAMLKRPDANGVSQTWSLTAVNERFRLCRYRAGQQFNIHQDGVHHRGDEEQSCLTFMIYLTDGDEFEGGDTVFYSHGPGGNQEGSPAKIIDRVRPRAGSLILFDHSLWHAGEVVTCGVKHIMRSDVLYRRESAREPFID